VVDRDRHGWAYGVTLSALRWFPVNDTAVRNVWIFKICVEVNTHAVGSVF